MKKGLKILILIGPLLLSNFIFAAKCPFRCIDPQLCIKAGGICHGGYEECEGLGCCCEIPGKCDCPPDKICICNPLRAKSFEELIDRIINFVLWIAIAIAPLMIVIAAFHILTSGGDPKKVETGKNIILYTIVGLFIVILAKGIVIIIRGILGY